MSTMTLEHDLLASYLDDGGWHCEAENVRQGVDLESYEIELRLIDWLNRHTNLAQPKQAVDVGAIREVIERLRINPSITAQECADSLAVALSGENAGPVDGEVLVAIERGEGYEDVHPELVAEDCLGNATERGWRWRVVSASPAPDKEGL